MAGVVGTTARGAVIAIGIPYAAAGAAGGGMVYNADGAAHGGLPAAGVTAGAGTLNTPVRGAPGALAGCDSITATVVTQFAAGTTD